MPSSIYKTALQEAAASNSIGASVRRSFDWMKNLMQPWRNVSDRKLLGNQQYAALPTIGGMFFFHYDAKTKDRLPYWDAMPLVMVLNRHPGRFIGLNFHYLNMRRRAYLMDFMNATFTKDRDQNVRISYALLQTLPKDIGFRPCIKQYLNSFCRSQFIPVRQEDWMKALFLPIAKFQKKSEKYVWQQAENNLDGR